MKIIPINFSIVVVGQDCNPTILNPDFLKYQGIVPDGWGWKLSGPVFTTPLQAVVTYDSGLQVKVEQSRFQVTEQGSAGDGAQSRAADIASNYIRALPHVRYTGVGINFRSLLELEMPERYLRDNYLKAWPNVGDSSELSGTQLRFVYPREQGVLNLSLEGTTMVLQEEDKAEKKMGLLVGANYHRECKGYPTDKQVLRHLEHALEDAKHYSGILSHLPPIGDLAAID